MKIVGHLKTTLLDYPGKVATTIFLNGCNFRCGYCHNSNFVLNGNNDEYNVNDACKKSGDAIYYGIINSNGSMTRSYNDSPLDANGLTTAYSILMFNI